MRAVQNLSPHETYTHKLPNLSHLWIPGSTVYIFLYEEKQTLKSEKWALKALKRILMGYDGHTIYWVYLKDQKKVIWVKDLRIFEDYKSKLSTEFLDYNKDTPIFQGFLLANNNNKQLKDLLLTCISQKTKVVEITNQSLPPCKKGQKIKDIEPIPSIITIPTSKSQKVEDVEFHAKDAMKKTRISCTIKLYAKAKCNVIKSYDRSCDGSNQIGTI